MTEQEFINKYCCTDSHAEYCDDDCDSCERKFKKDLEVTKERIRTDAIKECIKFVDEWDSVIADALAKNIEKRLKEQI